MSNQVEELEDAVVLTLMIGFMVLLGWGLWKAKDFFWGGGKDKPAVPGADTASSANAGAAASGLAHALVPGLGIIDFFQWLGSALGIGSSSNPSQDAGSNTQTGQWTAGTFEPANAPYGPDDPRSVYSVPTDVDTSGWASGSLQ